MCRLMSPNQSLSTLDALDHRTSSATHRQSKPAIGSFSSEGTACSGIEYILVPENQTCSVDRSSLSLHASSNLVDWALAGFVDYTISYTRHFANPAIAVHGRDLLVVSEATIGGSRVHPCGLLPSYVTGH
jgi:hypothetical protein